MKIKDGADLKGLSQMMRIVLVVAEELWESNGQELVVTSGLDGVHSAGSLHYYGLAVDLRIRYFKDKATQQAIANELQRLLRVHNRYYQVVLHRSHIHVEYDVGGL